jgi:hypothetical protein
MIKSTDILLFQQEKNQLLQQKSAVYWKELNYFFAKINFPPVDHGLELVSGLTNDIFVLENCLVIVSGPKVAEAALEAGRVPLDVARSVGR